MFKKILLLIVVAFTVGSTTQIQAQSVNVSIGGSATGTALTVTASKTDVICNGGSTGTVTGVASGGSGYAYTINATPANTTGASTGIFTGLPAGTYIVSATATGGCSASATSVTVAEPTALTVSATVTDHVNCNGDATAIIQATAAGHTGASSSGAYAYTISGPTNTSGATNGLFIGLSAGSYTITATKNGCTASTASPANVNQPSALVASFTPATVQIACGATTASSGTVGVTGGTSPYNYAWTAGTGAAAVPSGTAATSAPSLTAGTYNVSVTDSRGCITRASALTVVTITAPNTALSATVTPTQIVCNTASPGAAGSTTGSIAVTAVTPGAASPTYAWSPNTSETSATASSLAAGAYTVTISATGYCPVDYTRTINAAPAAVTGSSSSTTADGCQVSAGSVIITGSGGASGATYEVKWISASLTTSGTTFPTATGSPAVNTFTASPATFTQLTGGYDYRFVIKDNAGCTTPN